MWQQRRRHYLPRSQRHPLVTVGISAHNEEKVIVRCLDSIRRTCYPHLEIIVADDASTDATKQLIRDYALRHPNLNLRVYRMRQNVGKGGALSTILRRYGSGELVMTLDADSVLTPEAIKGAVPYFNDPTIAGVAANVRIMHEPTVLGVLQRFEHMIGYRSKKAYSLMNCEFVVGGVASTYRMSILRDVDFYDTDTVTEDIGLSTKIVSRGNRAHRMVYGANVVAMTEGVDSFRALVKQRLRWKYGSFQNLVKYHHLIGNLNMRYTGMLTVYRLPMALLSEFMLLLTPFTWGYILYITLSQGSLDLIIGAYATITAYVLLTVWFDEHMSIKERLHMTMYAPIVYFIFYIMDLVQLIAITRCLMRGRHLIRQKNVGSKWVSPRRIGREFAAG